MALPFVCCWEMPVTKVRTTRLVVAWLTQRSIIDQWVRVCGSYAEANGVRHAGEGEEEIDIVHSLRAAMRMAASHSWKVNGVAWERLGVSPRSFM